MAVNKEHNDDSRKNRYYRFQTLIMNVDGLWKSTESYESFCKTLNTTGSTLMEKRPFQLTNNKIRKEFEQFSKLRGNQRDNNLTAESFKDFRENSPLTKLPSKGRHKVSLTLEYEEEVVLSPGMSAGRLSFFGTSNNPIKAAQLDNFVDYESDCES